MKNRLPTLLTVLLVALLIAGAVCIGAVKGYREDRKTLLLNCAESHAHATDMARSIDQCEADAAAFDRQLETHLLGKAARAIGVEPISESVAALHEQLLRQPVQEKVELPDIGAAISDLLDDHIDTKLSFGKVLWTVVLLSVIFRRGRGGGLWKLLAGFGIFKLWRKK